MKRLPILFFILLFGCKDSEENASTNLRKGDDFFNKGEYRIAEYYYDRIPEESVLYKTVLHRRLEIQKIIDDPTLETHANKKAKGVFVTKHSFQVVGLGAMPQHKITVVNNTDKTLQFVELEFIYLDDAGKEVQRLSTVLTTNVPKNAQRDFDRISPGIVHEKFTKASAVLIKPVFY